MKTDLLKYIINYPVSPKVIRFFFKRSVNAYNENINSILVIKLDEIGDTVLVTPFIRELRRNYQKAKITLIIRPEVFCLFEFCPYIDEIIIYKAWATGLFQNYVRFFRVVSLSKSFFKNNRFDLSIIPRWDVDNYFATFIAYLSGAQITIGYSEHVNCFKASLNKGYDKLLTTPINNNFSGHEVMLSLDLLRQTGCQIINTKTELWITEQEKEEAINMVKQIKGDIIISIAPGALYKNKQWPVDRFIKLCFWCHSVYKAAFVILGGKNEYKTGQKIESALPKSCCLNLAGKTSLRQTAAFLHYSSLLIGNDTGVKHIAAAMNVRVIEITRFPKDGDPMHRQSPFRFRAWGVENIVLQPEKSTPPCTGSCNADEAHCILDVSVDMAKEAIKLLLSN